MVSRVPRKMVGPVGGIDGVEDFVFLFFSELVDRWRQLSPWEKEKDQSELRFFASSQLVYL
jgi:hypothetical protein